MISAFVLPVLTHLSIPHRTATSSSRKCPSRPTSANIATFRGLGLNCLDLGVDVSLLPTVAVIRVEEGDCPNLQETNVRGEENIATRIWYTVRHLNTQRLMDEFTICSCCLGNISTTMPQLREFFFPASPTPYSATCDLVPDSQRCTMSTLS